MLSQQYLTVLLLVKNFCCRLFLFFVVGHLFVCLLFCVLCICFVYFVFVLCTLYLFCVLCICFFVLVSTVFSVFLDELGVLLYYCGLKIIK